MAKVRKGFVTNSSSSSFIIGKMDDEKITIDYVYSLVRILYKEYLKKRDKLLKYIENNPQLGIEYVLSEHGYTYFRFKKGEKWDKKNSEINKSLERMFGFGVWETFYNDSYYKWLECETYKDYEAYWIKEKANPGKEGPFTIIDFLEPKPVKWLHFNSDDENKSITEVNEKSCVLSWYFPNVENAFDNLNSCEMCEDKEWCEEETKSRLFDKRKDCEETKRLIKEKNIPRENACLYMLGRVCIRSECGNIPEYIVNELIDISEFSCNHMG